MNTSLASKLQFILLAAVALTLVNCSKGGSGSTSTSGTCSSGQVSTAAGCLATCGTSNGVTMVTYNNQCVASTSVTSTGSTYGVSCGNGMITSQYGCLQQCGTMAVMYNGSCQAVTTNTALGSNNSNICSVGCGSGQVATALGCMPQYSCGTCYGYNNGYCYIGNAAHQYYGY